jgi:transcriptional regulator with XRE-family HTH domain
MVTDLPFGEWVKAQRIEAGLTQQQLASLLFIQPNTVSRWERGLEPRPGTQDRVRAFFASRAKRRKPD